MNQQSKVFFLSFKFYHLINKKKKKTLENTLININEFNKDPDQRYNNSTFLTEKLTFYSYYYVSNQMSKYNNINKTDLQVENQLFSCVQIKL